MAIYKRGRVYWYHFIFNGEPIQESTKQRNRNVARQIEAAHRTALAKGEAGIFERPPAPTLKDFRERFTKTIETRSAEKPRTVQFYMQQYTQLLDFDRLASARLDKIDEALIEEFVQRRSQQISRRGKQVSPGTVNRSLATLRRALRLAQEWRMIEHVARIRLLPGERNREFVLSHEQEADYLAAAPEPLRDVAKLILDTGLRIGEACALEWPNVHTEPAGKAKSGYIHVQKGKGPNAKRNVTLTARVREMLLRRRSESFSFRVFTGPDGLPLRVSSLDHQHEKLREALKLPEEFVLHSLRHTYGTRLGEAGVDAYTIMKLMGHSSLTVSQKYVHPTPEAVERAVERLEAFNRDAEDKASAKRAATVSATLLRDFFVGD
jgi:integrase